MISENDVSILDVRARPEVQRMVVQTILKLISSGNYFRDEAGDWVLAESLNQQLIQNHPEVRTFNRPLSVDGWSEILEFLEREKILLWKSTQEGWMYALCELNPNSKLGILLGTELLNITRISRGKSRVRQALRGLEKDEQEKILEAILAELA